MFLFELINSIRFYNIELMSIVLQMDLLKDLAELSPIIAVLVLCIGYLSISVYRKDEYIKTKEKEIRELEKYIRETEKETLNTLTQVSNTLDRVIDSQKNGNNIVLNEIDNLKDLIIIKLNKDG